MLRRNKAWNIVGNTPAKSLYDTILTMPWYNRSVKAKAGEYVQWLSEETREQLKQLKSEDLQWIPDWFLKDLEQVNKKK